MLNLGFKQNMESKLEAPQLVVVVVVVTGTWQCCHHMYYYYYYYYYWQPMVDLFGNVCTFWLSSLLGTTTITYVRVRVCRVVLSGSPFPIHTFMSNGLSNFVFVSHRCAIRVVRGRVASDGRRAC
jgi:hypothetical protein